jgi:hypothetical protein
LEWIQAKQALRPSLPAQRRFAMGRSQCEVPTEEIARRAYELWEARGRPPGDGTEDWEAAVAELTSQCRRNGSAGGLWNWWDRMRRSIVGRDG